MTMPHGDRRDLNEDAHRHLGAAGLGGRNVAHGTITSMSGTSFVLSGK